MIIHGIAFLVPAQFLDIRMYQLVLKGGEYGHFHIAFLVPMFSLGDAETQNSIFKMH